MEMETDAVTGYTRVKVFAKFNCKVYNSADLTDVKTITNGQAVLYFQDL